MVFVSLVLWLGALSAGSGYALCLIGGIIMARRHRMNRRYSEHNFTRYSGSHPKNQLHTGPAMRGGIRL